MLRNRYKNLPTSLHPVSPQKFLQVRVQCEPAGKLVRVQCEPAGKLVIAGEPEQPDNPWGVTPFKKVILLPAAINANQTSAVVTLHGQLYVRAPLANPAPSALSPQLTPIPAPELPPPPLPPMGGGQGQGGQGQGQGNQGNQGQMGQGQGQQGVAAQGMAHTHGHGYGHEMGHGHGYGHVKQQPFIQETNRQQIPKEEGVETSPLQQQQHHQQQQGGIEARAGPQQGLAAGHAALMQQHANPLPRQQQAQPQVPFQVQSQVQLAQQQMQPTRTKEGSADVDMVGGADRGEGLRDGKDGNVSVNKPNYTTESQNGMPQLLQQPQQGKQVERETGTNDMKIGMAVTAAS
ncbi:unnamed protein product [Closterium sp. Naga37s-1]|nr:unnamed protein product [Closterium sp. Naga37s-1]